MPLPWLQIVQWVPSILDVSRELLKKSKRLPVGAEGAPPDLDLATRVVTLEENERRQADLIHKMAEQISALTRALTVLHKRMLWLGVGCGLTLIVVILAISLR